MIGEDSLVSMLVEKLADVIPTVMFMVGWPRIVLLGPRPGDHLPGLRWTPRETAYLVHLIKVFGITFVLVSALMLTMGSLRSRHDRRRRAPRSGAGAPPGDGGAA